MGPRGRPRRAADAAGIDQLVVSDHVVFGENLEAYARPELGGSEGGKQPTGPDGLWLEPLTALTFVAGVTSQIRLGTNILLAALRRPVVLAKTAATLDVLSGGRLDLGVGVGWQREEYDAAGLDFDGRGALLDETLAVCQTLWRDQRATFDGKTLSFDGIHQMPKPAQAGGVPVWVSGTVNAPMLRRLARFGSAWIPWGRSAGDLATAIPLVRSGLEDRGRDPGDLRIVGYLPMVRDDDGRPDLARSMAAVPPLVDIGVTDFRAALPIPDGLGPATDYLSEVVGSVPRRRRPRLARRAPIMAVALPHRALGASGINVSVLALGSWMTFEGMSAEAGVAVMRAAHESGIDFLDDARYDDRTGTAPIPTGYSEVVFGDLFRASGWRREDAVVANKLWLEFWPDQSPAAELDASLTRMGFDYVDLIYSAPPPDGLALADLVAAVGALVTSGKARAWGVLNWPPEQLRDAARLAREQDVALPSAAQLAHNLVQRSPVEDAEMIAALEEASTSVVASAVLAGGVLSGKYRVGEGGLTTGRLARGVDAPQLAPALQAADELAALATELGTTPAELAIVFALSEPHVASVLFGATSPEQVEQNVRAADTLASITDEQLVALRRIGR